MSDRREESENSDSLWARLWRRPHKWYLFGIPAGAVLAVLVGVLATTGFQQTLHATNSLAFCTSCHEMEAFVFAEYKETAHYENASGVRAICADCHVPKAFWPKVYRKMQATVKELPNHFLGKIDTEAEFEAHRAEMAERVWARMRANDSKTCRSCHSYESMALDMQDRYAKRKHSAKYREATGKTCIDCHSGIAHKLPDVTAAVEPAKGPTAARVASSAD
ncbi:NapC/NirT family cytochrome c [Ectothiorhodospiraceae bacterium WFHF3C12]|nr:NapC/NirT family cytochrome c [Ectothiorhodospiraceae bacterium WFHF3C12]